MTRMVMDLLVYDGDGAQLQQVDIPVVMSGIVIQYRVIAIGTYG